MSIRALTPFIPKIPLQTGVEAANEPVRKPQDPKAELQQARSPLQVKSADGQETFTFHHIHGSCYPGQEEQVARALQNYEDHLELFSKGNSILSPIVAIVAEEPLTIRYVSTATFEKELAAVGYGPETVERLKKDKVLGLYTNIKSCPNTIWLIVDSWYKPGTPVNLYPTTVHELGHAKDDYDHYDPANEPGKGWWSMKNRDVLLEHWRQGYARIGYADAEECAARFNEKYAYTRDNPTPAPTPDAKPIEYEIKKGDKLILIAKKHGCNVDEILALNPAIANPNRIQAGQTLKIPRKSPPITEAQRVWWDAQEVIDGMERRLSRSFQTSYMATGYQRQGFDVDRALKEFVAEAFEALGDPASRENFRQIDPHFAEALEKSLHFRKNGLSREKADEGLIAALKEEWVLQPYTVQSGDTFSQICVDFGYASRQKELAEFNGIQNPDKIRPGQIIRFPKS